MRPEASPHSHVSMSAPVKRALGLALALMLAGCATTPAVGSRHWHDGRIAEIEAASQNNEISEEEKISLKNEADAVRVQYQESVRSRLRYGGYPSFPHHSAFAHHHHHH